MVSIGKAALPLDAEGAAAFHVLTGGGTRAESERGTTATCSKTRRDCSAYCCDKHSHLITTSTIQQIVILNLDLFYLGVPSCSGQQAADTEPHTIMAVAISEAPHQMHVLSPTCRPTSKGGTTVAYIQGARAMPGSIMIETEHAIDKCTCSGTSKDRLIRTTQL